MENEQKHALGRLLAITCRTRSTKADQYFEQHGLYRGQALLLILLSEQDGMTHSELAQKMRISPAAVTKVIKRMEQLQYVLRKPDPDDERVSRVYLQESGTALITELRSSLFEFDEILFSDFSEDDLQNFQELLNRILNNLNSTD